VRENENSLRKWYGGTAQLLTGNIDCDTFQLYAVIVFICSQLSTRERSHAFLQGIVFFAMSEIQVKRYVSEYHNTYLCLKFFQHFYLNKV